MGQSSSKQQRKAAKKAARDADTTSKARDKGLSAREVVSKIDQDQRNGAPTPAAAAPIGKVGRAMQSQSLLAGADAGAVKRRPSRSARPAPAPPAQESAHTLDAMQHHLPVHERRAAEDERRVAAELRAAEDERRVAAELRAAEDERRVVAELRAAEDERRVAEELRANEVKQVAADVEERRAAAVVGKARQVAKTALEIQDAGRQVSPKLAGNVKPVAGVPRDAGVMQTPPASGDERARGISLSAANPGAAVTVAAYLAGAKDDAAYEELDARAIDAARWTDKEISKLIYEIKQRGHRGAHNRFEVTFGKLFVETGNVFEALAGTCKTAKKYMVVDFGPDLLLQGRDDAAIVTLLKESHEGIEIKRRRKAELRAAPAGSRSFSSSSLQNAQAKCHVCAKTVYAMEFLGASDKAFHKNCFRCLTCNAMLKMNDYSTVDDRFYCNTHFHQLFLKNTSFVTAAAAQ